MWRVKALHEIIDNESTSLIGCSVMDQCIDLSYVHTHTFTVLNSWRPSTLITPVQVSSTGSILSFSLAVVKPRVSWLAVSQSCQRLIGWSCPVICCKDTDISLPLSFCQTASSELDQPSTTSGESLGKPSWDQPIGGQDSSWLMIMFYIC